MTATTPRAALSTRERRLDVERVLAERGLLRGPRRLLSSGRRPLEPEVAVAALRVALAELGPVFAAFGRFLSLRADLLHPTDCLLLEDTGDPAPPVPTAAIDARLRAELGRDPDDVFRAFDEVPHQVRWLDQTHRARLKGGERVEVRVVRPGVEAGLEAELEALAALRRPLSGPGFSTGEHFDEVLADFRRAVEIRLDLSLEADALQALGRDARHSQLLVVPQVYRHLSTSGVLILQRLPGSTIDEIAALPGLPEVDSSDVARRIGLVWLQAALVGHQLPIEADLMELPDGRLAVTGGRFATLPEAARANLWSYLRATAEHFPDRAAASLLREVTRLRSGAARGELRTRIRQVVPFRDGSWSRSGESLGEYALLHWRLLREVGFRARPHLDDFYQGLFWAARTARRFAREGDPLGEALGDLGWIAGWNQLRQLTSPQQAATAAESTVASLLELPQKVDRILSLATEEGGFRLARASPARRRRNATTVVVSLGLMLVALVLLEDSWQALGASLGIAAAWTERLLAAVFAVLGVALLRAARSLR